MPYKITGDDEKGYKVAKKNGKKGRPKTFSKAPLSKETAMRQMRAIYRSESMKKKK
jgi:hypothetical protein